MRHTLLLILLVCWLPVAAQAASSPCGPPSKFEVEVKRTAPVPDSAAPSAQALVYVLRAKNGLLNLGVAVDGEWKDATRKGYDNYFTLVLTPGEYSLCSHGYTQR